MLPFCFSLYCFHLFITQSQLYIDSNFFSTFDFRFPVAACCIAVAVCCIAVAACYVEVDACCIAVAACHIVVACCHPLNYQLLTSILRLWALSWAIVFHSAPMANRALSSCHLWIVHCVLWTILCSCLVLASDHPLRHCSCSFHLLFTHRDNRSFRLSNFVLLDLLPLCSGHNNRLSTCSGAPLEWRLLPAWPI